MESLADLAVLEASVAPAANKIRGLARGPKARAAKAAAHAASLGPILARIEAEGRRSLGAIARALTAEGIPTAAGTRNWTPVGVARVKAKLAT